MYNIKIFCPPTGRSIGIKNMVEIGMVLYFPTPGDCT
jgi:hypothetical protein